MKLFDLTSRLWEQPQVPVINTLRPRSPLFTYPDEAAAKAGSYEPFDCPAIQSLNGEWQFRYYETPDAVDEKLLYATDKSAKGWDRIAVPGCWCRQGYDKPQYCNVVMPFKVLAPQVSRDWNPTGLYRRVFTVRKGFQRVVLHFGGIESCGLIYVNGKDIGMVKDSRTASEFDVTDYVHAGENLLSVLVIRFSDGSFLEDQDHWRMAGIFRDVYLQYTPKNYIADVFAQTTLEADGTTGVLNLHATAGFRGQPLVPEGWSFNVQVYDLATGKALLKEPRNLQMYVNANAFRPDTLIQPIGHAILKFAGVKPWSAETPNLYRVTVTLVDAKGKVADATGTDIGFRSVRLEGGCLLINGKPVKFFGVNRHDFDETTGKAVSPADILADVTLMKQNNFNAIRTCHYPNDERLVALCNRFGLYVISEANIESHAYCYRMTDDPLWLPGIMERVRRMALIYKNNPCIHLWSLGNESGIGSCMAAASGWLHHFDPTRLVHYGEFGCIGLKEDGVTPYHTPLWARTPNLHTDVVDTISPMYPYFANLDLWLANCRGKETRPIIFCEYSHAMGNSNGALADYFGYFRKYPQMQGGYIWDWIDQGLAGVDKKTGRKTWLYGGDFGEAPHDSDFCGNGMVSPDRRLHPACQEFKHLARTFNFTPAALTAGRFDLTNWNYFAKLDNFDFLWSIEVDGQEVDHGKISRREIDAIAPLATGAVQCKYDLSRLDVGPGCQVYLNITAVQRNDTLWAPKGFEVSWQQFNLTQFVQCAALASDNTEGVAYPEARPEWKLNKGTLVNGRHLLHFGKDSLPDKWTFEGRELLAGAVTEQFARGYTDNDGVRFWAKNTYKDLYRWTEVLDVFGAKKKVISEGEVDFPPDGVQIDSEVEYSFKNGAVLPVRRTLTYSTNGWLDLDVVYQVPAELDNLPRLGIVIPLAPGFENLTFFGMGPQETYADRQAGGRMGLYRQSVTAQYFPYLMPQETGNHTQTTFVQLDDGENALTITSPVPFGFSALHFTAADFFAGRHVGEMVPRPQTYLSIDARQDGLGTHSCGEGVRRQYQVTDGTYRLALRICPSKL